MTEQQVSVKDKLQEYLNELGQGGLVGDFILVMAEDVLTDSEGGQRVRFICSDSMPYRIEGLFIEAGRRMDMMVAEYEGQGDD